MEGTCLSQGTFTQGATAVSQTFAIPAGFDFIEVTNYTQSAATATANGFKFYWQLGYPSGIMTSLINTAGVVTADVTTANALTIYDPSLAVPGALNNGGAAITGFTAANPAVVTSVGSNVPAGSLVIFSSLNNQPQYNGIPFSAGYGTHTANTFSVDYLNSTGSTPSTSGNFRVIPFNPLFFPSLRVITNITAAVQAVVTLNVQHNYQIGQEIRFSFPGGSAFWGSYANLDGIQATVVAVDNLTGVGHNTITVDVNTVGFGTFAFPAQAIAGLPYTPASVNPFGENTAVAYNNIPQLSSFDSARENTGFIGVTLAAGALLPAGVANDVVYWVAGKSSYGGS